MAFYVWTIIHDHIQALRYLRYRIGHQATGDIDNKIAGFDAISAYLRFRIQASYRQKRLNQMGWFLPHYDKA